MRFLLMGDNHHRLNNPRSRNDDIQSVIIDKYNQIGKICVEKKVDYVLHSGDLFDKSTSTIPTLLFVEDRLNSIPVGMLTNIGNHDLKGNCVSNFKASYIHILDRLCENIIIPLQEKSLTFGNTIIHFNHYGDNNFMIEDIDESKVNIIITHSMITEDTEMFDTIKASEVKTNADLIFTGHNHKKFHIGKVYNAGALLRLTTSKGDMDREVEIAILDTTSGKIELERIPLSISDYKEVFDVKQVMKKKDILSEAMLGKLNDSIKQISSVKDILSIVMKDEVYDKEDLSLLQDYLGDDIL